MSEKTILKPLADRVVVRALTEEEAGTKSASGIIIPDTVNKEKNDQGIVVSVGPGRLDDDGEKRIPMDVKAGDRVVYKSWAESVKVGTEEYWIISESDILAVLT
jgi:chaperonin GroES